jgi:glycosyltransferase involved in cell wall biosynthesis
MRDRIPWRLRAPVRRTRNAVSLTIGLARQLPRWRAIRRTSPRTDEIAVSYGYEQMPGAEDVVFGGHVKFASLHRELPNAPRDFNLLYLGSSAMPLEARLLVRLARRRGAAFAWNQNGVAYRAWYGDGWEQVNAPRAHLLHEADHVFFQSEFCKLSSGLFYGDRKGSWEVLHNPVDTRAFAPPADRPERPLTLLLGGNQYQRYRLEVALETLAYVRRDHPNARLIVAGALTFAEDADAETGVLIERLGLGDAVELVGAYTQADAPALMRRADVLLHTKVNDPCPTIVLEAMACGVPVVYSATGGTPELVGGDAGLGVTGVVDWTCDHPPPPEDLATHVLTVSERLREYGEAARERAVTRFDLQPWIERHREVFAELIRRRPSLS